jgi:hypothetical protein
VGGDMFEERQVHGGFRIGVEIPQCSPACVSCALHACFNCFSGLLSQQRSHLGQQVRAGKRFVQ